MPVLKRFKTRVDHGAYNGAALLGLRGLVIKSHGSADAYAFEWAIKRGYDAVKNGVLERLVRAMEENAAPIQQAARDAERVNGATESTRRTRPDRCRMASPQVGPIRLRRASPTPRYPRRHNGSIAISTPACSAPAATCRRDRVTNQDLADRLAKQGVETSDEWIVARTGIHARHFAAPDVDHAAISRSTRRKQRDRSGGYRRRSRSI